MHALARDYVNKVFAEIWRNQAINNEVDGRVEQEEEFGDALQGHEDKEQDVELGL